MAIRTELSGRTTVFFEPRKSNQRHQGITNPAYPATTKGKLLLDAVSRMRLLKTYFNGTQSYGLPDPDRGQKLQFKNVWNPVEQTFTGPIPAGITKAATTEKVRITPSTGRKAFFFLRQAQLENLFSSPLPDRLPTPPMHKIPFAAKGIQSSYSTLNLDALRQTTAIAGLTGFTNDWEIEKELTARVHRLYGLDGKQSDMRFIPGRHFVYAEPMEQIRVVPSHSSPSRRILSLTKDSKLRQFPLLRGENRPHVLIYQHWSEYTYADLIWFTQFYKPYLKLEEQTNHPEFLQTPEKSLRYQTTNQLIGILKEIHEQLQYHPQFHAAMTSLDPGLSGSEYLIQFLSHFVIAQTRKNFIDAQIIANQQLILPNLHEQNAAFGGPQDFEESFHFAESVEHINEKMQFTHDQWHAIDQYTFRNFQFVLNNLVQSITYFLDEKGKEKVIRAMQKTFFKQCKDKYKRTDLLTDLHAAVYQQYEDELLPVQPFIKKHS